MFSQLDYQFFQLINHLAVPFSFLNPFMAFLSDEGPYLFYLGVIVYWFTRTKTNRRMVAESILAACVALGINALLGSLFYRDRPFVHHHVIQLIQHAANASFPSDHAAGAFVIAASIWIWRKRDGLLWLILASLVSLSRIWTGVHYPTDVIAGMLIGVLSAQGVHKLLPRWKFLENVLSAIMDIYEYLEEKVWRRKVRSQS